MSEEGKMWAKRRSRKEEPGINRTERGDGEREGAKNLMTPCPKTPGFLLRNPSSTMDESFSIRTGKGAEREVATDDGTVSGAHLNTLTPTLGITF